MVCCRSLSDGAPIFAQDSGMVGHLASLLVAVPLLWAGLFTVAGLSWLQPGSTGVVGLKEMYRSAGFVKAIRCTQGVLAIVVLAVSVYRTLHHDFIIPISRQ